MPIALAMDLNIKLSVPTIVVVQSTFDGEKKINSLFI